MNRSSLLLPLLAGACAFSVAGCGQRQSGAGGTQGTAIKIRGSDTLLQVGQAWAEKYKQVHPEVTVQVNGGGSGTGIKAMINGTADIATSSRAMKDSEKEQVKAGTGKDPVEHIVGFDGIAVYVHKDNPLTEMAMPALQAIYADGGASDNWEQITTGLSGKIIRASRNNSSGTYEFFREVVCGEGVEFKEGANALSGSKEVVEFVATTPNAIGYSGMGYRTEEVKWLPLAKEEGAAAHEPTIENVKNGNYPISRPLYLYTAGEPEGPIKDFLDWVKGPQGQEAIAAEKFVPLN